MRSKRFTSIVLQYDLEIWKHPKAESFAKLNRAMLLVRKNQPVNPAKKGA